MDRPVSQSATKEVTCIFQSTSEVLAYFSVSESQGLTDAQITASREKHGRNAIAEEPPTPYGSSSLSNSKINSSSYYSGGWTAFVDPAVILTILILNAVVGVSQESSAEKAIAALQEYSANEAKVIRNGHVTRNPADCRVLAIQSNSFSVDQAILTGESESVGKSTAAVEDLKAVKQDQVNMLFSGTTVVNGHATAIVVLTGSSTAIGDIHESITAQISEPTPLKQKLNDFGDTLAKVISVICVVVWLINIPHFNDPSHGSFAKGAIYYLKIAVSLGVAAIPEGLAVVITTCLALGTRKMAAKNAVVRSLPSVETLGSCSVICSDKTGTLTTNQMSVNKLVYINDAGSDLEELEVEGTTFSPNGRILSKGTVVTDVATKSNTIFQMAEVAALCNEAALAFDAKSGTYSNVGEPTEGALRVLVEKIGTLDPAHNQARAGIAAGDSLHHASSWYERRAPNLATYEFSRDRKSMSVLVSNGQQQKLLVKGAPENIIPRCTHTLVGSSGKRVPLTETLEKLLFKEVVEYGNRGFRVIALASVEDVGPNPLLKSATTTSEYAQLEQKMTLLGLVGMLDPPRPEVAGSIRKCKQAGIRVIVITEYEDLKGKSYTGREFDNLSESEQLVAAKTASLFSLELNQVTNPSSSIFYNPLADIGVAMGSGTDVSKLASDMVLADNNFATIEVAIEEGRSIYNNTQQFIRYLISSNIGEVVSIFLTAAVGMPEALIPVQLLWVNLVTDGLPATALSFNPPDHDIMKRQPRKRDEALIVAGYAWWFMYNSEGPQITFWQLSHFHRCSTQFSEIGCEMFSNDMAKSASTVSLSILVVIEMFNAVNALSSSESLLTLPLWENMMLVYAIALSMALHFALLYTPILQTLFSILPLNWNEWQAVLLISAPVIIIDEGLKFLERQFFMQKSAIEDQRPKKE
ncbi:hypothetical protein DID88_004178 [Monilinia fructigena]|uniref:Calcium-transporting ATPase n=1 Tax=Monilinia fructigena TaxID=38457 RepID=A0A395ITB0_9HELO|nr:hypothetical protein DID88_004178 [Monilinia fructigena]